LVHARQRAAVSLDDFGHGAEVVVELFGDRAGGRVAEFVDERADALVVDEHRRDRAVFGRDAGAAGVVLDAGDEFVGEVGREPVEAAHQVGELLVDVARGRFLPDGAGERALVGGRRGDEAHVVVVRLFGDGVHGDKIAEEFEGGAGHRGFAGIGVAFGFFGEVDRVPGGDVGHEAVFVVVARVGRHADVRREVRPGGDAAFDEQRPRFSGGFDGGVFVLLHHVEQRQRRL